MLLIFMVSNIAFVYIGYLLGKSIYSKPKTKQPEINDKTSVVDKVKDFVEDIVSMKKETDKSNNDLSKVTTKDGRDKYENDFF